MYSENVYVNVQGIVNLSGCLCQHLNCSQKCHSLNCFLTLEGNEKEMERENIAESTSSSTAMEQPPTMSTKLNVAYDPDFFNDTKKPCQPFLDMYPKESFGSKQRSFNADWYKYRWLEYSKELDACFCFPCRVFLLRLVLKTGNMHLNLAKGFFNTARHQIIHLLWQCGRIVKSVMPRTIQLNIPSSTLPLNKSSGCSQFFMSFVISPQMDFLYVVILKLTLSGDGLFLRTFSQLLFPLDPKLVEIHKKLPANAKYTSHDIQDEVIAVLASLTQETIAEERRKQNSSHLWQMGLPTIMADGTTNNNGRWDYQQ